MRHGKTETFGEALDLFDASHRIESDIDTARRIADELIAMHGSTDIKAVKTLMVERGLIDQRAKHHWMGAVFNKTKYQKTGEMIKANGHVALANRWAFKTI